MAHPAGSIVFPKSVTPSRFQENFALFDFELGADDIQRIAALDKGETGRTGPNPHVRLHPGLITAPRAMVAAVRDRSQSVGVRLAVPVDYTEVLGCGGVRGADRGCSERRRRRGAASSTRRADAFVRLCQRPRGPAGEGAGAAFLPASGAIGVLGAATDVLPEPGLCELG